ncbi:MAG: hypothetical protein ABR507_04170 [Actinomycetota bacterium]|nr:hypothetical protein [Actinomycetota bacterium]
MKAIAVIAGYTLCEHSRRKLIAFFAIASLVLTLALGYLVLRNSDTGGVFGAGGLLVNAGVTSVFQLFILLAALAVSMGNIGAPFANGEAQVVLARPVSRAQYALGRLSASWLIVIALAVLMLLETEAVRVAGHVGWSSGYVAHWASSAFNAMVVTTITTILSIYFSTPVIAAVLGYVAQTIAGGVGLLEGLARAGIIKGFLATSVRVTWYVFPKFLNSPLTVKGAAGASRAGAGLTEALSTLTNSPGLIAWAFAYLVGLVLLTLFLVSKREI